MFQMKKLTIAVLVSCSLVGCANISDSYRASTEDFQQYQQITQQFNVKENWWSMYNDNQLNQLVEQALANNKDLALAAVSVNKALYNANLLGANLVPTFSASTSSTASKNIETGGNSTISHSGSLSVSYTLDLWRKLSDAASAGEWTYKATQQDLESTKLSIINSVITTYYQLAYLNDAINLSEQSLKYYRDIGSIMQKRLEQGVVDSSTVDQTQQSILSATNTLISYESQRKTAEQTLRNLLNLKPNEPLNLVYPQILAVKNIGVNLDVPVSVIANRPDIRSYQYSLSSAFKDAKATQKSWFPEITLGGSLSSSGTKVSNALDVPFAGGSIGISLPFLSWNTVKWNVKISEASYETARINYEQAVTQALNEIDTDYYAFTQAQRNLENAQQTYSYNKKITQYYRNRYDAGVEELRYWLSAANDEKSAELSVLNAKYSLIQAENTVYAAMGGYYSN